MNNEKNDNEILGRFEPINDPSQDRLGRTKFAEDLADSIIGYDQKSPLTIGLYGTWGYGKTSVLNMVKYHIEEKTHDNSLIPIIFDPWVNFQSQNLIESLFNAISINLREKELTNLADEFAEIAKSLKAITAIMTPINPWIAAIFGILTISINRVSKRNKKSLSDIKNIMKESLERNHIKLVIIIDDVDRLLTDEIMFLFQTIKNIMDLPNIIFVISFDENAVADMLDAQNIPGHEYIEKIIQWPISIPFPDRLIFKGYIAQEIRDLALNFTDEKWDNERWFSIYEGGLGAILIKHYNLRKLYRFIAQTLINAKTLKNEINPIDYVAIEAIKVFYKPLYDLIYDYRLYILGREAGEGHMVIERMSEEIAGKKPLEYFKNEIKKYDPNVNNLLNKLFPNLHYALEEKEDSGGLDPQWHINKQICSRYHFENYFIQDLATGTISQVFINDFIFKHHKREEYNRILHDIINSGLFDNFIERINVLSNSINNSNTEYLASALMDISEELEYGHQILMIPIHHYISHIIIDIIINSAYMDKANELYQIMSSSKAIFLPVLITWMIDNDIKNNKSPAIPIQNSILDSMKRLCVEKIDRAFKEDKLQDAKGIAIVLERWIDWGKENYVKYFVEEKLDDKKLINLLAFYISSGLKKSFDMISFSKITDIYKINTKLRKIKPENLNDAEKESIKLFIRAFDEFTIPGLKIND